jgi:branched-chain amino acid transport system substrate-binding protein
MRRALRAAGTVAAAAFALFAPQTASAQTAPPVKIGVIFSFSGAHALLGNSIDTTIAAWLAQHKNLVGGRPVQIIKRDDNDAPETSKREAQELVIADHVDFLVGAETTPHALAIEGVSTASKTPFFIVNSNTDGILADAPYAMRFAMTWKEAVIPLAQRALKDGAKTAYAVAVDISSGTLAMQIFGDTFAAGGGKLAGTLSVPFGTTDWSAYLLRMKDAKPQAIFVMVAGGSAAVTFLKSFGSTGLGATAKLYATADLTAETSLPANGDEALGVVTSSNYTPLHDSAANRQFVKAYEAQLPKSAPVTLPSFIDVQFYDIFTAIDKAVAAQSGPLDAGKSMSALRGLAFESPRGPVQIDAQTRELRQNIYLRRTERRNGTLYNVDFETIPPQ